MGKPMCLNLLKAGYQVTAFNRTASKTASVEQAGARIAPTPAEAASGSDIIVTIVSDTPDVEAVILGTEGIIHGAASGSVVIDMSTISPAATRNIAAHLKKRDIAMLDAPVSGGDTGAVQGTLAIMAGGEKRVFEHCLPVLKVMGQSVTHVGPAGMGQITKLCNQILVTVTNMAVCEAILFAEKSGLDPNIMIAAVRNGAAGSWQLSNMGPKISGSDFDPGFMIDLQQKDLKLILEAARENRIPLPAASLVHQLFSACQHRGEGRLGTQALYRSYQKLTGDS